MAVEFPAALPVWQAAGHSLEQGDCFAAPQRRVIGLPRRRRVSRTAPETVTASLLLTASQMAVFAAWYEDDLQAGSLPFTARVMGLGTTLAIRDALFVEPYRYTPQATARGVVYRVDATLRCTAPSLVTIAPDVWEADSYSATGFPQYFARYISLPGWSGWVTGGAGGRMVSTDGLSWTAGVWNSSLGSYYIYDGDSDGAKAIFNTGSTARAITSLDGIAGQLPTTSAPFLGSAFCNRVRYVGGQWWYASANGQLLRSPNGLTGWQQATLFPLGSTSPAWDVAVLGSRIVACAGARYMAYSDDGGASWTQYRIPISAWAVDADAVRMVRSPGPDADYLVAVIGNGRVIRTTDGVTWSLLYDFATAGQYYTGWMSSITDITWGDGSWVIVGAPNRIHAVTSRDDLATLSLVEIAPAVPVPLNTVGWGAGRFVGVPITGVAAYQSIWSAASRLTLT